MVNDNSIRQCNHLSKSESFIFSVLLKHIDKRNCKKKIFVIQGIILSMIMGSCSGSMYKYLAVFLYVFCIALAVFILAREYNKLAHINVQLRAILLQSENLNDQE